MLTDSGYWRQYEESSSMSFPSAAAPCYSVHRSTASSPDWTVAACLTSFTFPWESTLPPSTEFRALWDDQTLFFRFDCVDHDLVLGEGETVKERVLDSDRVEIFFTPDLSLASYYAFEMTPRAEALVYAAGYYRDYDWDWNCPELRLTAAIQGNRYHVEGSLPLEMLRSVNILKPGATQFYVGVFRAEFSHQADGTLHHGWMPWVNPQTERPDFHVPSAFGIFELV
jgi:hypothetical protein